MSTDAQDEPEKAPQPEGHWYGVTADNGQIKTFIDGELTQTYQQEHSKNVKKRKIPTLDPCVLRNSKLKIGRARFHINELERAINVYSDANPYQVVTHYDTNTGENVMRVRMPDSLPLDFSAIIGDAVHNLRTALDYLVNDLIRINGQIPAQNAGLALDTPSKARAKKFKPGDVKKIKGVSAKAERYLLWLKNSQRTNDLLYKLNWLDILDKHNTITVVLTGIFTFTVDVGMPFVTIGPNGTICFGGSGPGFTPFVSGTGTPETFKKIFPLKDNAEIYRCNPGFERNFQPNITIALGETKFTGGEHIFDLLDAFVFLIERIIAIFERRALRGVVNIHI